jgi:hypothetical protein
MKFAALFFLLLSGPVLGSGSGYFPLDVGDLWVYESAGSRCCTPLILEITDTRTFNGNNYSLLHSSAGDNCWLRGADDGSVFAYDPQAGWELLWYGFQVPEGEVFSPAVPRSSGQATISGRCAYSGTGRVFENAVTVVYPGIGDSGLVREVFAPGVGLVQRIEYTGNTSVASYQLVYARVGGNTLPSGTTATSGIAGRVFRGPVCPVQTANDPKCADQPFAAVFSIQTADRSREVAITASDENGYFRVVLPPGDYVVAYQNLNGSKFPRAISQTVTVLPGDFAGVTILLDTGIR